MKRIAPNRCGYSGYTCSGIPVLSGAFVSSAFTYDTSTVETLDTSRDKANNYKNIPEQAQGMVMSVNNITAYTIATSAIPEVNCNTNTDPKTDAGFFDAFNSATAGAVVNGVFGDVSTSPTSGSYKNVRNTLIYEDSNNVKLYPGILEPMITADYEIVSISDLTYNDAALDGIIMSLQYLSQWRNLVDYKLNEVYAKTANIQGGGGGNSGIIKDLKDGTKAGFGAFGTALNCTSFKIYLNGDAYKEGTDHPTPPSHSVNGGIIYDMSGNSASVSAITNKETDANGMSYWVAVKYDIDEDGDLDFSATLTSNPGDLTDEYQYWFPIGSIKVTYTDKGIDDKKATITEIVQDSCFEDQKIPFNEKAGKCNTYTGEFAIIDKTELSGGTYKYQYAVNGGELTLGTSLDTVTVNNYGETSAEPDGETVKLYLWWNGDGYSAKIYIPEKGGDEPAGVCITLGSVAAADSGPCCIIDQRITNPNFGATWYL